MSTNEYYVYALLDPREKLARPFYVGKGLGNRNSSHLVEVDSSPKGRRIQEIREAGEEPVSQIMISGLSDGQAYLLEAQLIGAFGTESTGGILTNQVIPGGEHRTSRVQVTIPWGAQERAAAGRELLCDAVLDLVKCNPQGVTNADVASVLALRSDHQGGAKDYLTYSIIGILLARNLLTKEGKRYLCVPHDLSSR